MDGTPAANAPSISVERLFERELGISPIRSNVPETTLVSALAAEQRAKRAAIDRLPGMETPPFRAMRFGGELGGVDEEDTKTSTDRSYSYLTMAAGAVGLVFLLYGLYRLASSSVGGKVPPAGGSGESLTEHLGRQLQESFTADEIRALFRTRMSPK